MNPHKMLSIDIFNFIFKIWNCNLLPAEMKIALDEKCVSGQSKTQMVCER